MTSTNQEKVILEKGKFHRPSSWSRIWV